MMQIDEDKLTREAMQLLGLIGTGELASPNEIDLGRTAIQGLLCPFKSLNSARAKPSKGSANARGKVN